MNETLSLILSFMAGILMGILYFAGLWWTVQKVISSSRGAAWVMGSMLIRTGLSLTGFYFISDGSLTKLLLCIFGFVLGRAGVLRLSQKKEERPYAHQS